MRILIVTDAWEPQVNGVVRTLKSTRRELERLGHQVELLTPLEFRTLPCPTYPDIRLSLLPGRRRSISRLKGSSASPRGPTRWLGLPGSKWVAGDGPALARLKAQFPEVRFTGVQNPATDSSRQWAIFESGRDTR